MSKAMEECSGAESASPVKEPGLWADLWEIAWLPAILAILAMGTTWAVWYFTTEPGATESVRPVECDWDSFEKCFSLNLVNKMFTHAAIAGGAGGISFYIMLRRERLARQAAERRADSAERRLELERQRVDEMRQRADELNQRHIAAIEELVALISNARREQTDSDSA